MPDGDIGYGSEFEVSTNGGSTWASVGEVTDLTPPSDSIDVIDTTHMGSPNRTREFIAGLRDPGECSVELNFAPGSAGDSLIRSVRDAGEVVKCRITFPNAVIWTFDALLTGYEPAVPLDDKMTATLTFKVTASYSVTPAAAPTNTVLPAVSGIAQEDEVLTALTGVWTGAPVFTYQWQTNGSGSWADISGATAATYTVLTADVGDNLRVVVTGTNDAGSASANSAATDAVIAAA